MINMNGKWALLTGASRGIGYEIAVYLADLGCNLILHSRSYEHTEKVYNEVMKSGIKAHRLGADLSKPSEVDRLLKEVDALGIEVDFVFNNAGIQTQYRSNYLETPADDFNTCFQVNTIAPMMVCYHFLPKMVKRGSGRIVNTTSGIRYEAEQAAYSGSKAALDKCTIDLAEKYRGTNVMLSLVDPGWCRTDMGGEYAPNDAKSALPGVILGAVAECELNGKIIRAQEYSGMELNEAAERITADK